MHTWARGREVLIYTWDLGLEGRCSYLGTHLEMYTRRADRLLGRYTLGQIYHWGYTHGADIHLAIYAWRASITLAIYTWRAGIKNLNLHLGAVIHLEIHTWRASVHLGI